MDQPKYVMVARVPPAGVEDFKRYEAGVLELLAEHGGVLERRLRSDDELVEVHVIAFYSHQALCAYRQDSRRTALEGLLGRSGAQIELLAMNDVPVDAT